MKSVHGIDEIILSMLLQFGGADVDAATDRYGNRPSDEACRYNFQRGMGLLRSKSSAVEHAGKSHADPPESSSKAAPAAHSSAADATQQPQHHAAKLSPRTPAPVAHGDVSVAIGESSDLVAAALEDLRSHGSKAQFLLPSLLCSAVSSGVVCDSSRSHCAVR